MLLLWQTLSRRIPCLCLTAVALVATSGCATLPDPFFYRVEKGNTEIYVLGTAHTGFAESELPSYVKDKFKSAGGFASEVRKEWADGGEKGHEKFYMNHVSTAYLFNRSHGLRLSARLTPAAWQEVQAAAEDVLKNQPHDQADFYPPEYAYRLIMNHRGPRRFYVDQELAFGAHEHMDLELYEHAKKIGKVMVPLDSAYPFDHACEDKLFIRFIELVVAEKLPDPRSLYESLYHAYKNGSEGDIENFLQYAGWDGDTNQCVVSDRNTKWAAEIESVYQVHQPLFVAVGVGHLVGEKSLLRDLEQRGFHWQRYKP